MNKLYFSFLLLLLALPLGAQEREAIRYTILLVDTKGIAVDDATMELRSMAKPEHKYSPRSEGQGRYLFEGLQPGDYRLRLVAPGYQSLERELRLERTIRDTLTLKEVEQELSAITVMASYTKRTSRGTSLVNLRGNPIAKGKNGMEVLCFISGLKLSKGQPHFSGREEAATIYIDDRKSSPEELAQIPSSMIQSIELLPHVGAAYAEASSGGVLLVRLKTVSGLIGSLGVSYRTNFHGSNEEEVLQSSLQYKRGNFRLFNTLLMGVLEIEKQYLRQDRLEQSISYDLDEDNRNEAIMDSWELRYDLGKGSYISTFGSLSYSYLWDGNSSQERQTKNNYMSQVDETKNWGYSLGALYRQTLGSKGNLLELKLSYQGKSNSGERSLGYSPYYGARRADAKAGLDTRLSVLSLDPKLEVMLSGGTLSLGLRTNLLKENNRQQELELDAFSRFRSMDYTLKGLDLQPWAQYSLLYKNRLYLELGLVYAFLKKDYIDHKIASLSHRERSSGLYPSLRLDYLLSERLGSVLSLAYRWGYSYPNYGYYAPEVTYQTERLYTVGNPNLKRATNHRWELGYKVNANWAVKYHYTYWKDLVQLITREDPLQRGVYFSRPENAGKSWRHYLGVELNKKIAGFWHTNTSLYLLSEKYKGAELSTLSTLLGFTSSNQFSLLDNLGLTLDWEMETKRKTLELTRSGYYSLDLGAYYSLFSGKLLLNASASKLLYKEPSQTRVLPQGEILREDLSPNRILKLSATWLFSRGDKFSFASQHKANDLERETPSL